jgi:HlyD family secretion protein
MKKLFILCFISTALLFCGKKEEKKEVEQKAAGLKPDTLDARLVVGIATIEPVNRIMPITSETNGTVDNIFFNSGQDVKKSDIIFSLEHDVEEAQLAQSQSKLKTQQDLIIAQTSTLQSLKIKVSNAKNTSDRMFDGGAITQQTLDDSKSNYESLQQDLITSDANIAQQKSRLRELEQDIKYAKTILDRKFIRARVNGTILNLDLKLGSIVTANASIGDFAPEGPYMALTEIDELYANKVKTGQPAYIRLQGAKDTLTLGKVIFASPYLKKKSLFSDRADNLEDRRVREVRVQLEDKSKVLIGSRVECVIVLKSSLAQIQSDTVQVKKDTL